VNALQRSLMTLTLAVGLVAAAATLHAWSATAQNLHEQHQQHGQPVHPQTHDPQAHVDRMVEHLSLTDGQRDALAEPLAQLVTALQELHRLHEAIATELTDQQKAMAGGLHEGMAGHHGAGHPRPSHHGGGKR